MPFCSQGRVAAAIVAVGCWSGAAVAQVDPAVVAAGRSIVQGQTVPAARSCGRCHGVDGAGNADIDAPRIAGQSWFYLAKQLADFAAGVRPSEVMEPVARALTPDQRLAAAAYFASLHDTPWPPQPPVDDPLLLQAGGALSGIGAPERGVRACIVCHADAGKGLPPSFPYLAGQHVGYLEREMLLWKEGRRRNDPLGVMAEIARAMTVDEIRAVAIYFARARPPLESISRAEPIDPIPADSPRPAP